MSTQKLKHMCLSSILHSSQKGKNNLNVDWINKNVIYPHNGIFLAIRRNEVLIFAATWIYWGCHDKVPQTGWLNRNLLTQFWGLEV